MGRGLQWDMDAWEEYCTWQKDKKTLKRINALIKEVCRDPFVGSGKPEALKHELTGLWSRRINNTDRLTYKVSEEMIIILACKGHYD